MCKILAIILWRIIVKHDMKILLFTIVITMGFFSYQADLLGMKRKADDDEIFYNKKIKLQEDGQCEVPDVIMEDFVVPMQVCGGALCFEALLNNSNNLNFAIQNRHADMITFINSNESEIQKLLLLRQKIECVVSELELKMKSLKIDQCLELKNCYSKLVSNNNCQKNYFSSANKEYKKALGLLKAMENFLQSKHII